MGSDKRNTWLQKLDQECPYQVVLRRRPLVAGATVRSLLATASPHFRGAVDEHRQCDNRKWFALSCYRVAERLSGLSKTH